MKLDSVNENMKSRIRYDAIEESLTWTRKLSIQLNLAHVASKTRKFRDIDA